MLATIALIIGFGIGWMRAARRGGTRAEKWQYACAHALIGAIAGLALAALAFNLGFLGAA